MGIGMFIFIVLLISVSHENAVMRARSNTRRDIEDYHYRHNEN